MRLNPADLPSNRRIAHACIQLCPQNIRSLVDACLSALSAFGSMSVVLALDFFIYAYVGVQLFGELQWDNKGAWNL